MPHLVLEYSDTIEKTHSIPDLMSICHKAAMASGQFSESDIKVRAYPCPNSLVGGLHADFLHVTVKLLSGRTPEIKKELTNTILEAIHAKGLSLSSLTVEALDIERESYSKIAR